MEIQDFQEGTNMKGLVLLGLTFVILHPQLHQPDAGLDPGP